MTSENQPVPRNPDGTLKPGAKLGKGRQKGSKNKATILREKMENKVSIKLSKAAPKIVDVVIDQAKNGDRTSQKMVLDRVVPVRKAEDGDQTKTASVEIVIRSLTRDNVDDMLRVGTTIEGECEAVPAEE